MENLEDKKIAIIGLGKMGGILLKAFLDRGLTSAGQVRATVRHDRRVAALRKEYEVQVDTDSSGAAKWADLIILCVKPHTVLGLLEEFSPQLREDQVVISVAAAVTTGAMQEAIGKPVPVIRAMPNTPCSVGCGMTAICRGEYADKSAVKLTTDLFDSVGRTAVIDESHFDAVTGLSASGPAFIYIILESLAEAGVKVGLPREVSTLLAAQTTLGAAQVVLETSSHPALLKDAVTTPAGCTIDGILELEEGKLRVTLIKAVVKAAQRSKELVAYNNNNL
jgi:pyrroline-5-carboxylate reductase